MELGKALGLWCMLEVEEIICHNDISAFNAPGECHNLAQKGLDKDRKKLIGLLEANKWPLKRLKKEVEYRTGKPFYIIEERTIETLLSVRG